MMYEYIKLLIENLAALINILSSGIAIIPRLNEWWKKPTFIFGIHDYTHSNDNKYMYENHYRMIVKKRPFKQKNIIFSEEEHNITLTLKSHIALDSFVIEIKEFNIELGSEHLQNISFVEKIHDNKKTISFDLPINIKYRLIIKMDGNFHDMYDLSFDTKNMKFKKNDCIEYCNK